jgi:cell division protein FtsI (penicillin-binding protein 3)
MKASNNKYLRLRTGAVGILFVFFLAAVAAKAVYLQIYRGPWLSQKAAGQYVRSIQWRGKRGTIYDRKGESLAVSLEITSIAAFPPLIDDPAGSARALAKVLQVDPVALRKKLASKRSFVWVQRQVAPKVAEAVRALNLAGVDFIPEHSRFYPKRTLLAQVLGFTGIDGYGLEGLEFYYDNRLNGRPKNFTIFTDGRGNGFDAQKTLPTEATGGDLFLTIDLTVQFIAERALAEAVTKHEGRSGIAVVMVPRTGAVLAMAHFPAFNPNTFKHFKREQWRNRIITDPFEPGSTMKIFSAAAAIETGQCSPHTIFYCENGAYQVGANVVHDIKPHGWLSLEQIIKYSSNIGAVKLGEMVGAQYLAGTLRHFGFGDQTGIDCPGETPGSLAPHQRWSEIDTGAIAFGQGISVSAIQLAAAVSAIANDGVLMRPYLVEKITDGSGRVVQTHKPEPVRRAIAPETARTVNKMMRGVIGSGGTGTNAALEGYSVCGKTGTAQKIDQNGTYAGDKFTASFIGFAPATRPEVAIVIVVDEPRQEHYGGIVAAPVFRRIAQETLNYLNVAPEPGQGRIAA